jgi:hypothetical protein
MTTSAVWFGSIGGDENVESAVFNAPEINPSAPSFLQDNHWTTNEEG